MGEFFKKHDTIPPYIKLPRDFFEETSPPRYREEAKKLIPQMWNKKTPEQRKTILGIFMPDMEKGFFKLSWEEVEKNLGKEEALQFFLRTIYGDDKDPLYDIEDTI